MPYTFPEKDVKKSFKQALKDENGCRLVGEFNVLLVPGNFHIGFHSFGNYLNMILNSGIQFQPNFEHQVEHLSFGMEHTREEWENCKQKFQLKELNTLENYDTKILTPQTGPFSYHYKLLICPTNLKDSSGAKTQVYQYRSFWNLAYIEMGYNYLASFDYE